MPINEKSPGTTFARWNRVDGSFSRFGIPGLVSSFEPQEIEDVREDGKQTDREHHGCNQSQPGSRTMAGSLDAEEDQGADDHQDDTPDLENRIDGHESPRDSE